MLSAGSAWFEELKAERTSLADKLLLTSDPECLSDCQVYIVAVPTPIDKAKRPDLEPLLFAPRLIARYLKPGDVVIFESTVYPGATEEDSVPVLARDLVDGRL